MTPSPPEPVVSAEKLLKRDYRSSRLLLVEDGPINREVTLSLLSDAWPEADIATDGLDASRVHQEG